MYSSPNRGGLTMPLLHTFRQAWADPDLRSRILFIFAMFAVFVLGVNIPVPIPGVNAAHLAEMMKSNALFSLVNIMGGGAARRLSIFALGLNPYITSQIIMQVLTTALPNWKKELDEGGAYAREQQNKRSRFLSLGLCVLQGFTFYSAMVNAQAISHPTFFLASSTIIFWTAGAMFMVWLGEQISQKGIGNGVSLMIFAGIVLSAPAQFNQIYTDVRNGAQTWYSALVILVIFLATAWIIVLFTTSQRRIPMQHMRRQFGTKVLGGQTSYLPIPINTAGVIPIIFAISLLFIPAQIANFMVHVNPKYQWLLDATGWLSPAAAFPKNLVGSLFYAFLIFFFTYFYTAIQYNVEDISNNLKRGGSFIPGVRPGKQTKDFLDGILSRITVAGAAFLTVVALAQYIGPALAGTHTIGLNIIGGTSLLIMVSVAIETMRQIEASLLMKQYGS